MEFRQTHTHWPVRIDVVIVRQCLRSLSIGQLRHCRRLAVTKRCYHLAGLLSGECGRRAIPLPTPTPNDESDETPDVTVEELAEEERATAELRRREAGIGGAP